MEYVEHPLIKPNSMESRIYQKVIVGMALSKNTLCVLGTGLGKTAIATLTIAEMLYRKGNGKVLIVAPSRPLVEQHSESLKKFLNIDESKIVVLTGKIPPSKREKLWKEGQVFIATPQIVENDIVANRLNVDDFILLIADEAHHTTGNHSYTFVASVFRNKVRVLGLTASPGSDIERVMEICENLGIEHVEVRTHDDYDVREYVKKVKIKPVKVDLPKEYKECLDLLKSAFKERLKILRDSGIIYSLNITKSELLSIQKKIMMMEDNSKYELIKVASECIKLDYAIEVLECQGKDAFLNYYERLGSQDTKSSRSIIRDSKVLKAVYKLRTLDIDHPKMAKLIEIVKKILKKNKEEKIIIFAQYRDMVSRIVDKLSENGIKALPFIGQSNRDGKGMSQKEQVEVVNRFKNENDINVLVSTSVSEEGIDIMSVNYVIFYEPVPSEVRFIQRRGRASRGEGGECIILIAKDSRDEGYYWSAINKENKMKRLLKEMQKILNKRLEEKYRDKYIIKDEEVFDNILRRDLSVNKDSENDNSEIENDKNDIKIKITDNENNKNINNDINNVDTNNIKTENKVNSGDNNKKTTEKSKKPKDLKLDDFIKSNENLKVNELAEKEEKGKKEGVPKIIIDNREKIIGRYLYNKCNLEFKNLDEGDYILSNRLIVERKTSEDLENSIIDKRLFKQMKGLKKYERAILIVEGKNYLRLPEKVVKGALLSIMLDFNIPVIFTENYMESAETILKLAEREQLRNKRATEIRTGKKPMSLKERQRFIVESLPDIGPITGENLLLKFGTIENIVNASEEELKMVDGIGEITAKKIKEVLTTKYEK